jgi:O-antigen/teichoic acid export membrane protein
VTRGEPTATGQPRDLLDTPHAGPAAIRGGAIRVVGYGGGVVITALSAALLFRYLGPGDGGRYVTVIALVSIAAGLTDAGLTGVGMRELVDRHPDEREPLIRNLLGMRIVLGAVGLTGAVGFAVLAGYGSAMVIGAALAGVGVVIQTFQNTLAIQLMVDLRLGWVTILELVRQIATVVGIVVLVLADAGLVAFLALLIPASLVAVGMTIWLVRGEVPMRPSFDWNEWRRLIRDVAPFAALVLVTLVYFRLALIALSLVSTPDETGYFGASFRVTEVLISIPQLAAASAFPIFVRAARDDSDRLAYGVGRVFHAMTVLGAGLALVLALGATFVIDVVAGPDFAPAAAVMRIQALTLFVVFLVVTFNYALLSLREHRIMLIIMGGALVLNAVGAAVFGAAHGARGAALATMGVDVLVVVATGVALWARGFAVGTWLRIVPRVVLAVAPAAALWFAPVPDVVKAVLGAAVYGGMLLLLRAVPEELAVELRRLRGQRSEPVEPSAER